MSTGLCAVTNEILRGEAGACHHIFIRDESGFSVCTECGLVDEENLATDPHLLVAKNYTPLGSSPASSVTMLGYAHERQGIYHRLARREKRGAYTADPEMLRYFHIYLSRTDLPLSIQTCMMDYHHIAADVPAGKARWARILAAVLLIIRLRSQYGEQIHLRSLLHEWDVTRSDYHTVTCLLDKIPCIHMWITAMRSHQPSIHQILDDSFHQMIVQLSLDRTLAQYTYGMIIRCRLTNRLDIQIAAALLAAHELHPELLCVSIQTVLNAFPTVSEERIYAVKRRFLKKMHSRVITIPEDSIPIEPILQTISEIPRNPMRSHRRQHLSCIFLSIVDRCVTWITVLFLPHFSFSCHQNHFHFHFTRKQIAIREGYFPPPVSSHM